MNPDEPIVFLSPRDDFIPKSDYAEEQTWMNLTARRRMIANVRFKAIAPDLEEEEDPCRFFTDALDEDGLLSYRF